MQDCKPLSTLVDVNSKLSAEEGELPKNPTDYRKLAGALQYLTFTRPYITYAVQQICLFMHAPRHSHFNALKRIIRYIQGTKDQSLQIYKSKVDSLTSYSDADWTGCPDTRRSTSCYCVYLGHNLISWSSKRQQTVSRSSAEVEYIGVANTVAETCWIISAPYTCLQTPCNIKEPNILKSIFIVYTRRLHSVKLRYFMFQWPFNMLISSTKDYQHHSSWHL